MGKSFCFLLAGISMLPQLLFCQGIAYKGFPEWSLHKKDTTEYALYTPAHLQPGKKYPIVLFMHGCCGVDYHASLRNAVDPPARMWHQFGENKQAVPTYIISPATAEGWKQHFTNLKAVMDELVAQQQGDPQRIYVCGFSMGGKGVYQIIQAYPGYFAAAIAMGMDFSGDSLLVKDIPLWMNQGETDWWSRNMRRQVGDIRALNGLPNDTGNTWVTGVNPRYSNFKGVGHGVQWLAASTQAITSWAYSKINDGNRYPVVFFEPAVEVLQAAAGKPLELLVHASDPDGSISKVDVFVNHVFYTSVQEAPYLVKILPVNGDNLIEAVAIDNRGKKNTAVITARVMVNPQIKTASLPPVHAGDYYHTKLKAQGNGEILFSLGSTGHLPPGIQLYPDGTIQGITTVTGAHLFSVRITDAENKSRIKSYRLLVSVKQPGRVLVSGVATTAGKQYRLAKMQEGASPHFNSKDTMISTVTDEINFSDLSGYEGLSFIQTDINDADSAAADFLHFDTDEAVIVYICYEKLDKPASGIPEWLTHFKKEAGQVTAQYRYFDIYSKKFPKGRVVLPGAAAKANGVSCNYFVMIKKQ